MIFHKYLCELKQKMFQLHEKMWKTYKEHGQFANWYFWKPGDKYFRIQHEKKLCDASYIMYQKYLLVVLTKMKYVELVSCKSLHNRQHWNSACEI